MLKGLDGLGAPANPKGMNVSAIDTMAISRRVGFANPRACR
jgi:hypothetical protein